MKVFASKLRGHGFKFQPGIVSSPVIVIMWGGLPSFLPFKIQQSENKSIKVPFAIQKIIVQSPKNNNNQTYFVHLYTQTK